MIERKYACLEIQKILKGRCDIYSDEEFKYMCKLFAKPADKGEMLELYLDPEDFDKLKSNSSEKFLDQLSSAMDAYRDQGIELARIGWTKINEIVSSDSDTENDN